MAGFFCFSDKSGYKSYQASALMSCNVKVTYPTVTIVTDKMSKFTSLCTFI